MDFKPLVDFMKYVLEKYGIWRFSSVLLLMIVTWRSPELITAIRWW